MQLTVLNDWLNNMRETVFAPSCVLCHAPASLALDLCAACRAELPRQRRACRHCALTLPADSDATQCRTCLHQPRFDAAHAAFEYGAPVDWLITRLKYHNRLSHARLLGLLLAERIAATVTQYPDYIVPIPLHPRRYRERGYNQAEMLARQLARHLRLEVNTAVAVRSRHTAPQLSLPAGERRRNVRNAFAVRGQCRDHHIAILDDVVTTGHTASALANALRQNGAAAVQLWCVARA